LPKEDVSFKLHLGGKDFGNSFALFATIEPFIYSLMVFIPPDIFRFFFFTMT